MPDCDRKTAYSSLRTTYFLRPMLILIERFFSELTERQLRRLAVTKGRIL
ncbi:unnamed protein product, partial [marine sediment metagenome]